MREIKYICDFCKKEINKDDVAHFFLNNYAYELCDKCYDKVSDYKKEYEERYENLYNEFKDRIISMKK